MEEKHLPPSQRRKAWLWAAAAAWIPWVPALVCAADAEGAPPAADAGALPPSSMPAADPLLEHWLARPLGVAPARALRQAVSTRAQERPGDAAAAEWLARAFYWEGLQLQDAGAPEREQLGAFEAGVEAARRARALDAKLAGGWFWDGVNSAKIAEIRGIARSVTLLPHLRNMMDRTDALAPGFFFGGTGRFRGAVITRTPSMLVTLQGGSNAEGMRYLAQARKHGPTFVGTRRFQAELLDKQDRRDEAIRVLEEALALKDGTDPEEAAWNRHERALCAAMLARLRTGR